VEYKIVSIPTRRVNVYLVIADGKWMLVDVGAKKYLPIVYEAISSNGLELSNIKLIVLTHTHYDHVDGLKEISERTGARILVHKNEAESLSSGYTRFPSGTGLIGKFIVLLGRKLYPSLAAYEPVEADIVIDDRYEIGEFGTGVYIIPTPGHTSGSVSLIINNQFAFVGDSMFGIMKESIFPPFANDTVELMKSWQLLADSGCQNFYPGHGTAISRERFDINFMKYTNKTR